MNKRLWILVFFTCAASIASSLLAGPYCDDDDSTDTLKAGSSYKSWSGNLSQITKEALAGDLGAIVELAMKLARTEDREEHYPLVAELLEKPAGLGHPRAAVFLGSMYFEGRGVPRNYKKAANLFSCATRQGDLEAATALAGMLRKGLGLKPDIGKAIRLYRKASKLGYHKAQVRLANLYFYGTEIEQNYEEAASLYGKAAMQGNNEAQLQLGLMFEKGLGLPPDGDKAMILFNAAAGYAHLDDIKDILVEFL